MLKTVAVPLVVGVASALATVAAMQFFPSFAPSRPAAGHPSAAKQHESADFERPTPEKVTALARLEPEDGIVDLSGTPGDRLMELKVRVGDRVKSGDALAVLESHTLRQAELELAQAQLEDAEKRGAAEEKYAAALRKEAELARKQAQLERLELNAQKEKIAGLKVSLASVDDDLRRLENLRQSSSSTDSQIVSDQQLEHQRTLKDKSQRELAAAESQLKKLQDSIGLSEQQAEAKISTAEANQARIPSTLQLDSLRKSVELAERRLELTTIRAPSDGEILKLMLSEGETLAQQPILEMADTSRMVAVAEIYEDDALHVKEGARASAESEALDKPIEGTVAYVGSMVAKNSVMSLTPTASADLRVVEARIRLEPNPEARRLINLQVTVSIPVDSAGKDAPKAEKP
ncbi:MAG TPA: HlyD family efflux transporter periplasmic adaptor subunit [Pirellulales bacterium]|nr:HlyD family efflux transporter periplasmic adaptor subunit [Pirellulales bacterium]